MISTVKSTCSSPAWAEYRSGVLVAVPKFGEELDKALMEQREKDIAATDAFMKEYRKTGGKFKLTAEQLKTLSDNYNPRDMSYKEYMSFIDRLCEYGILNEDDKDYVHYSAFGSDLIMIPLKFDIPISTWGPRSPMGYSESFSSCGGNVLEWSYYLSQFETFNQQLNSCEKTRSAVLYGKICDVLQMMR